MIQSIVDNSGGKTTTNNRSKAILYWAATAIIVLQSLTGAFMDLTKNPDFVNVFTQLGYPLYLLTILGVWRILGAIALVVPKLPRLKEWAYAGLIFDFTGAGFSHTFIADVTGSIFPFVFAGITFASWAFRPTDRKL